MATLPGLALAWSGHQEPPAWMRSPEISAYQQALHPFAATHLGALAVGSKNDTQPVDEPRQEMGGTFQPLFGSDWYHRIHLLPSRIDLGNLVRSVARELEVWNAYLTPQTLNAITGTGSTEGLSITGQPAPPLVSGALQSRAYDFTASTVGDPVIEAAFVFEFAAVADPTLTVTGRRIIVFGVRPHWEGGVLERWEWSTEILEAYGGEEQRIRLRRLPRRGFEYAFLGDAPTPRVLESLLFGWGARTFCLPVWTDPTVLTSPLLSGSTTLTVADAAHTDYHVGGFAVVWQSDTRHEAVEIAAIVGNTLTLKNGLSSAWSAGCRVYPARLARLEGETAIERLTATVAQGRLRWAVEDLTAPSEGEAGPLYQGYRVFEWRPDRSEVLAQTWRRKLETLDFGTGQPWYDDLSGRPSIGRELGWLLPSRAQAATFCQWLAARAGRCNPCWLPSAHNDLVATRPLPATDNALYVQNTLLARFNVTSNDHHLRLHLAIRTRTGQSYYRQVTGVAEISDDEELLALDSPLGVTLNPADFLQISWLELVRLDSDGVELHWETDRVARVTLPVRVVTA